jgi:hypothetical protein
LILTIQAPSHENSRAGSKAATSLMVARRWETLSRKSGSKMLPHLLLPEPTPKKTGAAQLAANNCNMKAALRVPIILVLAIILCGCVRSTKPQFTQEIDQPDANFILYVSNQSFEKPEVDISVIIDGETVVNDLFQVKNKHYWKTYSLKLPLGNHQLSVKADNGTYKLERSFEITNKHWAVISFWCTDKKDNGSQFSGISFAISEEPSGSL